jgi:hypothetical protein
MAWLITTTGAEPSRSARAKSSPASRRVPWVAKYPSLTAFIHTMESSRRAGLNPATSTEVFHIPSPMGVSADAPARRTPGTARSPPGSVLKRALRLGGQLPGGIHRDGEHSLRSNPGSIRCSREKVESRRPAPTTSTIDRAICPTTSARRAPAPCAPAVPRPCARSSGWGSPRAACHAGARPKRRLVTAVTTAAKHSTRAFSDRSSHTGSAEVESSLTRNRLDHTAKRIPSAAPAVASTRLSVMRSWRMTRDRPAPMAIRTAISRRRAVARTRRRFARLAHATISTSATTPISASTAVR